MKKILFVLFLVALISVHAQMGSVFSNPSFLKPDFSFSSFINPNMFQMSHSVSFTSGFSSGTAFYRSVYTNHLKFTFNPRFHINLDLNFVNMGSGTFQNGVKFNSNHDNSSFVIPDITMSYKPTQNTTISFQFRKAIYMNNNFNSSTPQNYHWRW